LHAQLLAGEVDHYTIEKRYLHAEGTVRWAALTVRLFHVVKTGEVQEISTTVDITGRKRVEDELRRKEAQFRFIFEQAPIGISWMHGRRADTRLVNSAHERITGVTMAQAADTQNYFKVTHPTIWRSRRSSSTNFTAARSRSSPWRNATCGRMDAPCG